MFRRGILAILLLISGACISATLTPQITAKYTESQLNFYYPPRHITSVCGDDMFGIERRSSAINKWAWVCVRQDAVNGEMDVTSWDYFDTYPGALIREPTSGNRSFIFATNTNFMAFDPVTLQQTVVGTLSPSVDTIGSGQVFTLMPEGTSEVLLASSSGWQVRAFPGGGLLYSLANGRWLVGHFLSSQSTQLVSVQNSQFDLYDAHAGSFIESIPFTQNTTYPFMPFDPNGNGQDKMYFSDVLAQLVSMNLASGKSVATGSPADSLFYNATPIDWNGGTTALAGLWYDTVRIMDSATGTVLYSESLPDQYNSYSTLTPWSTDFNDDGKQDLLWVTFGHNLYYLQNGGSTRFLQTASAGFQVAGTTGPALDVLVTGDAYISGDGIVPSRLDIVVRDPDTLKELWRRTDPAPADSQVFLGEFGADTAPVVITADEGRIAAERLIDGQPLWEISNDEFTNGNAWDAFAVPSSNCVGAACKRVLIASVAKSTATYGSFQEVVDTTTGNVIWSSTPDGCLGCAGTTLIAFADITGDGVPDILRMLPYQGNQQFTGILQALDGVTFQELWHTQVTALSSDPIAISVATVGTPNIGVWTGQSLMLLSGQDGHLITSETTIAPAGHYETKLNFAAFGPDEGVWVLSDGFADVEWAPADLSSPTQNLPVPTMWSMSSEFGGALFAAGPEGVFRVQMPTDHIFSNGFEAMP
jgi:hypothetical protein